MALTTAEAVDDLIAKKRKMLTGIPLQVARGQNMYATLVKANMTGRPGPRSINGNLRRSVTVQPIKVTASGRRITGRITSNAPQAARLEFGFYGTDSRGRTYSQQPYPAWEPAVDRLDLFMVTALGRMI